jgi:molybdopterin converting factor small subunit
MAVVEVRLGGTLKSYAAGRESFTLEAANVIQMLKALGEQLPALKPILDRGVAVAIDGEIYREAWFQPLKPENEIYVLPKLAGG